MKNKAAENLDTVKLMGHIKSSQNLDEALINHPDTHVDPSLPAYLMELQSRHNCTIERLIRITMLSKPFMYQIFSGTRNPNRDAILKIAFAMGISVDETQRLLTLSRRGVLYPKIRRDAAIIFCLQRKCSLTDASEMLESIGETPLI